MAIRSYFIFLDDDLAADNEFFSAIVHLEKQVI